jgi:Fur family ferric uptake transcriptional regulator
LLPNTIEVVKAEKTASAREVHEGVAARLKAARDRYTTSRRAVVDVLLRSPQPLTVDEIVDRSRGLATSSVYRNLSILENSGVVRRLAGRGEFSRFELSEHPMGHHHHLACIGCGAMLDVQLPDGLESELDASLAKLARKANFRLESHWLDAVGYCSDCSA